MKGIVTILFFFLSNSVPASIFQGDDRLSFLDFSDKMKEVSQSSVALIHKHKLKKTGDNYRVSAPSLAEGYNFCQDSRFSTEPMGANCSGALITSNHILTAAHCITDKLKGYGIDDFYVIFNYKKKSKDQTDFLIKSDDVFTLVEEVHREFNMSTTWNDIAIYRLDRASKYQPAQLDFSRIRKGEQIFMLGYPLGTALKLSGDSEINSINGLPNSFRHHLDTFSVNSGSPIFNSSNKVIGVLARATGSNGASYGRVCHDWHIGNPEVDFGEGNSIKSIQHVFDTLQRQLEK